MVKLSLQAATTLDDSPELITLANSIDTIVADSLPSEIEPILSSSATSIVTSSIDLLNSAASSDIENINLAMTRDNPTPPPTNGGTIDSNTPPIIVGTPETTIEVNNFYEFSPTVGDVNGDTLTFSITNRPAWSTFNTTTGRLSGTPGASDVGTYNNILITVSDGLASSSLNAFSITVASAPTPIVNTPPTISGAPASSVTENNFYSFMPTAADADGDTLTFSITNRPAWATFNTTTGRLSGTPGASDIGTYNNIRITASDGMASASLNTFSITVASAPASIENTPPTISGAPTTTVTENNSYSFMPTAADADGDTLTFSITNRPAWAAFNTSTGRLSGTPGASDVGTYNNIQITVSDGIDFVSLNNFSISVFSSSTAVGSVTLNWTPPTTNVNGDALTNLAGYNIYYGTSAGNYTNKVNVNSAGVTAFTIDNIPVNTYYFAVTAYDLNGNESYYSTPTSFIVQ